MHGLQKSIKRLFQNILITATLSIQQNGPKKTVARESQGSRDLR
jgi:hypothetical protein